MSGYTLEEEFARGGFGEIWRAAHILLPREGEEAHGGGRAHVERLVLKRIALKKGLEVHHALYGHAIIFSAPSW